METVFESHDQDKKAGVLHLALFLYHSYSSYSSVVVWSQTSTIPHTIPTFNDLEESV